MNKLLFYTDFVNYRDYGRGMSGLSYKAIQYGPVPVEYNRVYSISDIQQRIISYESGKYGGGTNQNHYCQNPPYQSDSGAGYHGYGNVN